MTRTNAAHVGKVALAGVASLLVAMMWMLFSSGPVQAQTEPYSTQTPTVAPTVITQSPEPTDSPEVLPTRITDDDEPKPEVPDQVLDLREPKERGGVLPFTGGDVVLFIAIGGAAVAVGLLLMRRTRNQN